VSLKNKKNENENALCSGRGVVCTGCLLDLTECHPKCASWQAARRLRGPRLQLRQVLLLDCVACVSRLVVFEWLRVRVWLALVLVE
jgi:hypothetical protein